MQYMYYADQDFPHEQFKKIFKSKATKNLINSYVEILIRNGIDNPYMFYEIQQRGCTYAYVANAIVSKVIMDSDQELTDLDFKDIFGFSLSPDGETLDCSMLMIDMFAYLYGKVKLTVHEYKTYHYRNAIAAAKELLHKEFTSEKEAIVELFNNGIISDGIDDVTKENKYKNVVPNNQVIYGSYPEIAEALLNIRDENMDKAKLEKLLADKNITFEEHDRTPESKFSGLVMNNINAWVNYYLVKKNINIEFINEVLGKNYDTYDDFQKHLRELLEDGYILGVSSSPNTDAFITSSKEKVEVSSRESGHAMLITGFDANNDMIVSSWGKQFTIPKETYKNFQYTKAQIKTPMKKVITDKISV